MSEKRRSELAGRLRIVLSHHNRNVPGLQVTLAPKSWLTFLVESPVSRDDWQREEGATTFPARSKIWDRKGRRGSAKVAKKPVATGEVVIALSNGWPELGFLLQVSCKVLTSFGRAPVWSASKL